MPNFVTTSICLHNICIHDSNGFNMDQALEVQTKAQAEKHTTFNNMKGTHILKVIKQAIK